MSDQALIDDVIARIQSIAREAPGSAELGAKLKVVLGRMMEDLDCVSREEFEAQQAVLARTREKVERLEKELQDLIDQG